MINQLVNCRFQFVNPGNLIFYEKLRKYHIDFLFVFWNNLDIIMEIPVRFSTGLAEYTGSSRLRVALKDGATLADLLDYLCAEHPELTERLAASVAVVMGSHIDRTEPLQDGQEVAFLIPISGGSTQST